MGATPTNSSLKTDQNSRGDDLGNHSKMVSTEMASAFRALTVFGGRNRFFYREEEAIDKNRLSLETTKLKERDKEEMERESTTATVSKHQNP